MAVIWSRELPRERSQSGKYGETYVYSRSWVVRVDDPLTPLPDITNALSLAWLADHPDDISCKLLEFDTKAADDTGLVYTVTAKYQTPPVNNDANKNQNDPNNSGGGLMRIPIWSASSSITTGPVYKTIANSAGDPLEGLEQEYAEFRLTKIEYFLNHSQWLSDARQFTNKVNSDTWHGGGPRTWKCQGCSAQLQTENQDGATVNYWEVTWEFAYRDDDWNLKPWDVGFYEKCGSDGVASQSGDKKKSIKGVDGKRVGPVALDGGVAKPPGQPPDVINAGAGEEVYEKVAFGSRFGEIFTP